MADSPVAIVHDHYKETFQIIRLRERQRDSNFLLLIGVFALLVLEIYYPSQAGASVQTIHLFGSAVALKPLPLSLLLDASWVLALTVAMTYCRVAVHIDRQYSYLHSVEDWMSNALGDDKLYRREGRVYLTDYPALLTFSWVAYGVIFPLVLLLACVVLLTHEWTSLSYSVSHRLFDTIMAAILVFAISLYAVFPRLFDLYRRFGPSKDTPA